ncbi:MAG: hypothetical protein ACYDBB_18975 [Armatimonadota bacterium]
MKKSLVVALAACALVVSSIAFAAPVQLTNDQLDTVSAGSGSVFDYVFGNGTTGTEQVTATQASIAAADNTSAAVVGDDNELSAAQATDNGIAVSGEENEVDVNNAAAEDVAVAGNANDTTNVTLENVTVDLLANVNTGENGTAVTASENAVVTSNSGQGGIAASGDASVKISEFEADDIEDNDNSSIAVGSENQQVADAEDSNIVQGTNNSQWVDQSEIDGTIEEGGNGFVARDNTTITDSFNSKEIEIDVEVDIEDSYNVTTNTLDISGQSGITAIVNANALGDQLIGVNVALNSSTSNQPANGTAGAEAVSAINGNSVAFMSLNQTVINGSFVSFGLGPVLVPVQ